MSDEKLRAAYQSQVRSNVPLNRAGCPTADELNALATARQVGDNAVQMAQLDHVLSCAACRPEFELLRATHAAARDEPTQSARFFTPRRIGLAAMLLVAVGIGGEVLRRSQNATTDSETRAAPADASELVLVAPLSGDGQQFTGHFMWRATVGAAAYQLEILDSSGTALAQMTTADTTARLTAEDSARVAAVPAFDWMVTARRSDGNERRSALTRIRRATAPKR